VDEPETAVGYQINMKQLIRPTPSMPQRRQGKKRHEVKAKLHVRGRPAEHSLQIPRGEPVLRALHAQAAAVQDTSNTAKQNPQRRHHGKKIAGRASVMNQALGDFNPAVAAQKRPEDGFPRGQKHPAMGMVQQQPPFSGDVNEFGAEEGADQGPCVDEDQSVIASGEPQPEQDAPADSGEHEQSVSG
jgi:hypothetical protein